MKTRGGMSKNAFGGRKRLDNRRFLEDLLELVEPSQELPFRHILDCANSFLFFGLGRNGTTEDEYYSSYLYFYKVRSNDPSTWQDVPEKGSRGHRLLMEEIREQCFDRHYEASGLEEYWSMDYFLKMLMKERRKLIELNRDQVRDYFAALHGNELDQVAEGNQLPLRLLGGDLLEQLIKPTGPEALANLLYYSQNLKERPKVPLEVPLIRTCRETRNVRKDGSRCVSNHNPGGSHDANHGKPSLTV